MFVITADQRNSRAGADAVEPLISDLLYGWGSSFVLPPERTAGDEVQMLVDRGAIALDLGLHLLRAGRWSVGIGVGSVRSPLPEHVRESTGPAFIAARDAVDRAKKSTTRLAVSSDPAHPRTSETEALIDLLLLLRARRTAEGWQLHDLLETGMTQREAAARLGISPQSVNQRSRVASLRADTAATGALANLLDSLDALVDGELDGDALDGDGGEEK